MYGIGVQESEDRSKYLRIISTTHCNAKKCGKSGRNTKTTHSCQVDTEGDSIF